MSLFNIVKSEHDGRIIFSIDWRDYILTVRANPHLWLALTAILSLLLFAPFMGWTIAIVLLVSVFIHELGHAVVGRWVGLKNVSIHFIPLLGACTLFSGGFATSRARAAMALAGPAAGLLSAWLALALYAVTGWEPLLVYVVWTVVLTIFNLAPMLPLDGGHVMVSLLAPARVWVTHVVQAMVMMIVCAGLLMLGFSLFLVVPALFLTLAIAFHGLRKVEDAERVADALAQLFDLPPSDSVGIANAVRVAADRTATLQTARAARKKQRRWLLGRSTYVLDDFWFDTRENLACLLTSAFQTPMRTGDRVALGMAYFLTVVLTVLLGLCALGLSDILFEFARVAFMVELV